MANNSQRLHWISVFYLLFFVLAVLSPSLYHEGHLGFTETQLEELTIFVFGMAGIATFTIYERLMERRESERKQAVNDFQKAQTELIESYTYIGSINRKIELLKKLADDTTLAMVDAKRIPKELFHALAANARAAVGADAVLLRFVELARLRTEREFAHQSETSVVFRVANRDLRQLHEDRKSHGIIRSEDGRDILVIPSDSLAPLKGYLLLQLPDGSSPDVDTSLLKVFANQAEVLYSHFRPAQITEEPAPAFAQTGGLL